jgi:hydrogenase nickel incorporation protein HypA/HybF
MHEWALAEAIIAAASETAEKEGLKQVAEVKIRIGELQQIEKDILDFALSQLRTARLKNAKFRIVKAKARLKCRACGFQWSFSGTKLERNAAEAVHFVPEIAHSFIKCPECGSPDFEILEGRGVWLESIKGVK